MGTNYLPFDGFVPKTELRFQKSLVLQSRFGGQFTWSFHWFVSENGTPFLTGLRKQHQNLRTTHKLPIYLRIHILYKQRNDRRESSVQDRYPLTGKPSFLFYCMYSSSSLLTWSHTKSLKQHYVVCPQKYVCVCSSHYGKMQLVLNTCAGISYEHQFALAPLP